MSYGRGMHYAGEGKDLQGRRSCRGAILISRAWVCAKGACLCGACGQEMRQGFSFRCSLCKLDQHPSCVNLPMKFNHPHHPQHTLALCFVPPYPDKAFICDVCKQFG
ncbi:hypothetical protein SUGI_0418280 [Cryptomeria japonica]|nr:hypothetical protein SUGI_0418280 [Cryptomeria japonica]